MKRIALFIFLIFYCPLLAEPLGFVVDFCSFPREDRCTDQREMRQIGLKLANFAKIEPRVERLSEFTVDCSQQFSTSFMWTVSLEYPEFQEMGCQSFGGGILSDNCQSTKILKLVKTSALKNLIVYCDEKKIENELVNAKDRLFRIKANISTTRFQQSRKPSENVSDYPKDLNGSIEFKGQYIGECDSTELVDE